MKPKKIKLFWSLGLALLLLLSAAGVLSVLWPRLFPSHYVSDLYLHYEHNPHIRTTELHSFHINDTLSVDALLLQATDSVGWETLKKDFHAFPLPENNQKKIDQGIDVISIHLAPKTDPTLPMDTTDLLNNNVVAISRLHQTVSIFNVTTRAEMDAVRVNQFEIGL